MDYEVFTYYLTTDEIRDLSYHLDPKAEDLNQLLSAPARMVRAVSLVLNSRVLLPVAGAIGKSALDVLVDRVKNWLATRPEDRTVQIFGPDDEIVRIVKTGKEIRREYFI
jgi:hypothetical protein